MDEAKNYISKKTKGLWTAVKTGKGYGIMQKRFDVETGKSVEPVYTYIELPELKKRLANSVKNVENLTELVKDFEALN